MAQLKCAECGASVSRADVVCRRCGSSLLEEGSLVEAPISESSPAQSIPAESAGPVSDVSDPEPPAAGRRPPAAAIRCEHCGADVPDPRDLVCIQCMTELHPSPPPAGTLAGTSSAISMDPHATVHERGGTRLELSFDFGIVELSVGQEVMLGRDASDQRLGALHSKNNVSRHHATIGLTPQGAWVRDERSMNGTYVDGRPIVAGEVVGLAEGAELRLASNVRAVVRLHEAGEPGHG